jgi:hypothetical protein
MMLYDSGNWYGLKLVANAESSALVFMGIITITQNR